MKFFNVFLAGCLGTFAALALISIMLIGTIAGAASSSKSKSKTKVKSGSVLQLKMESDIVENAKSDDLDLDLSEVFPGANSATKMGLYQVVRSIRQAKTDNNIKGIYINIPMSLNAGWASASSIREELVDFKESGKFIIAYSEIYTERAYYLASVADKIYMPETGMVEFNGFASAPMFLKGTFEKLGIEPRVFKVGTYKSAVEPYIQKKMSDANREQVTAYLGDLWGIYAADVEKSRGWSQGQAGTIAKDLVFGSGKKALKAGLIDEVKHEDQVFAELKEKAGIDQDSKIRLVTLKKYIKNLKATNSSKSNKVAVVFAEGAIQSGKSRDGVMGSETIVKALRQAREDDNVKAVVLRVNSPGGSALASDMITREVELTKAQKPIIASMGDVAASGGYYISAQANKIMASPNTITGSIGIFGLLYDTKELFEEKLGMSFDEVETHEHANFLNPNMPMTEAERTMMQNYVNEGYSDFVEVVRSGRSFPDSASVDAVGQGRVWTGQRAKGLKLVDEYGDLDDAIILAADLANLEGDDYRVKTYPKAKTPMEQILEQMTGQAQVAIDNQNPLSEELKLLKEIKDQTPQNGLYMLMPYKLDIQ